MQVRFRPLGLWPVDFKQHGSVRAAEKATHPDTGGTDDDFAAVQAAKAEGAA